MLLYLYFPDGSDFNSSTLGVIPHLKHNKDYIVALCLYMHCKISIIFF